MIMTSKKITTGLPDLRIVLEETIDLTDAISGGIYVWHNQDQFLPLLVDYRAPDEMQGFPTGLPVHDDEVQKVISGRDLYIIAEGSSNDRLGLIGSFKSYTSLIIGLQLEEEVQGILFVLGKNKEAFTDDKIRLIHLGAKHIALLLSKTHIDQPRVDRARHKSEYEELFLRALMENMPDYIYLKDSKSRFVMANTNTAKVMGAENVEALIGRTDFDFYRPELAQKHYEEEQRIINSKEGSLNFDERIFDHQANEHRWISSTKIPIFDHDRQETMLLGISRDITESKESRDKAETMANISEAINSALELEEVAEKILVELNNVIAYRKATMQLIRGNKREILAQKGFSSDEISQWLSTPISDDLLVSEVVNGRQIQFLSEPSHHPGWALYPSANETSSWIGIPLSYGKDELVGILTLDNNEPYLHHSDKYHIEDLLEIFARQAAIAIKKASLIDELKVLNETGRSISVLNPDAIPKIVYEQTSRLMDTTYFSFCTYDYENKTFHYRLWVERGEPQEPFIAEEANLTNWLIENESSLLIRDWDREEADFPVEATIYVERQRSWLGVPMLRRTEKHIIGVISVQSPEPNAFNEGTRQVLETIASQAAIAFDNAKLHDANERQIRETESLMTMRSQMAATLDLDTILEIMLKAAMAFCDAERGAILFVNEHKDSLVIEQKIGQEWPTSKINLEHEMGKDISEQVWKEESSRIWFSANDNPCTDQDEIATSSAIAVPIFSHRGTVRGVMQLTSPHSSYFETQDVNLLERIAGMGGIPIEKAMLLSVLSTFAGNVSDRSIGQNLLKENLKIACELMGFDAATMWIVDWQGSEKLQLWATAGDVRIFKNSELRLTDSLTGQVIRNNKFEHSLDVTVDPRYKHSQAALKAGFVSMLSVPLSVGEYAVGALNILTKERHEPSSIDLELVNAITNWAANLVSHLKRYYHQEQIQNITRDLQEATTEKIVHQTILDGIYSFGYDRIRLYLTDKQEHRLISTDSRGMKNAASAFDSGKIIIDYDSDPWFKKYGMLRLVNEQPLLYKFGDETNSDFETIVSQKGMRTLYVDGELFTSGQVPHQNKLDRKGVTEWLDLPLVAGDRTLGNISIDNKRSQKPFTHDDYVILTQLSRHVALSLNSVRLLEQITQQVSELELLKERVSVSIKKMQETTNLEDIIDVILDGVQSLGFSQVQLYRSSEKEYSFTGWKVVGCGEISYFDGYKISINSESLEGARITYQIFETRKTGIVKGKHLQRAFTQALPVDVLTRTWAVIPLVVGTKIYGLIMSSNQVKKSQISPRDLELLDILVSHAGIAIANAESFNEMRLAQNNLQVVTQGVAHSLKNPLLRMRFGLDMIKRKSFEDIYPDYYYKLARIHRELASGLNQLLAFENLIDSNIQQVNLFQLISSVRQRYDDIFDLDSDNLTIDIPNRLSCMVDPDQLYLAFDMIMQNALEAMGKSDKLRISAAGLNMSTVVEFHNTGPSIPEDLLDTLGEEVQSTKNSTGIGLFIVDKIMRLNNGQWSIKNAPKGGVKVTLTIPSEKIHAATAESANR